MGGTGVGGTSVGGIGVGALVGVGGTGVGGIDVGTAVGRGGTGVGVGFVGVATQAEVARTTTKRTSQNFFMSFPPNWVQGEIQPNYIGEFHFFPSDN